MYYISCSCNRVYFNHSQIRPFIPLPQKFIHPYFCPWKDNSLSSLISTSISLSQREDQSNYDPWIFPQSRKLMWDRTSMHACRFLLKSTTSSARMVETEGGWRGQLFIRGHVNSNNWRMLITRFSNGARGRLAFISRDFSRRGAQTLFHHVNSLGPWNREIRCSSSFLSFLSLRYLDNGRILISSRGNWILFLFPPFLSPLNEFRLCVLIRELNSGYISPV